MKKFLATIVTLVLLISCCLIAATPANAEEFQVNYDDFDIIDGVILEYLGEESTVYVPSVDIEGNPVTKIEPEAFKGNKNLSSVYICEGITEIGHGAFKGCVNLTEVSLPYSLEVLGKYDVFSGTSIASLVIPAKVKEINDTLVVGATGDSALNIEFTDLIISEGVEIIRSGALYFKGSELVIPESVYLIEGGAIAKWSSKAIDVYICNPSCSLGSIEKAQNLYLPNSQTLYTYEKEAPAAILWDTKDTVKIYAPKGSDKIEAAVEKWKTDGSYGADYKGGNYQYIGISEERIAEKMAVIKERGIYKPTKYQMGADAEAEEGSQENQGNDKNQGNNNNQSQNNTASNNNLLIVIIICGTLLIIIALVAVMFFTSLKSKKKKKRKKKVAAPKTEEESQAEQPEEIPPEGLTEGEESK